MEEKITTRRKVLNRYDLQLSDLQSVYPFAAVPFHLLLPGIQVQKLRQLAAPVKVDVSKMQSWTKNSGCLEKAANFCYPA